MNIAQHLSDAYPTIDALLGATTFAREGSIRIGVKAYMRHEDLSPLYLPGFPEDAADDISGYIQHVVTDVNTTSDTMRTAQFVFEEFPGLEQVNLVRDLVQITMVFYDSRAHIIAEVSLGYFTFVIPDRKPSDAIREWDVQAHDLTERLARKGFLNTFTLPAGHALTQCLSAMAQMDKLPPSQGGRAPSGIPWDTNPDLVHVGGTYRQTGIRLSSVATKTGDGQYWITPDGSEFAGVLINAHGDPQVDPVSYAPIDPWSLTPMPFVSTDDGHILYNWFQASYKQYWWYSGDGLFYYPLNGDQLGLTPPVIVDVFKNTNGNNVPWVSHYEQGSAQLPLETWPNDWDRSGPYFEAIGVAQSGPSGPTSGGSSTDTQDVGAITFPTSLRIAARFAHDASGALTTLIPLGGPYRITSSPVIETDPATPGYQWIHPVAGGFDATWNTSRVSIDGYSFAAGDWEVTLQYSAGPFAAADVHNLTVKLLIKHRDGSTTDLGTSSPVDMILSGGSFTGSFPLAGVAAYPAVAGDELWAQVIFNAGANITARPSTAGPYYSGTMFLDTLAMAVPAGSTVDVTTSHNATQYGGTAQTSPPLYQPRIPSNTGTGIVWPDKNNPALTPAGCDTIGPNIPANRLRITPKDAVVPSPYKLATNLNFLAAYNLLLELIQYNHVWFDTDGNMVCNPSPWSTDDPPVPVLTLSTRTDQAIWPTLTSKIADLTTIANVVSIRSEPNGGKPMKSVQWNRSTNSYVSIDILGDTILKAEQHDDIRDQVLLDAIAAEALDWAALGQQTVTFDSFPCPWVEPFDAIMLDVVAPDGTVIIAPNPNNPFIVRQFTIDPEGKKQSWIVSRWVPL